MTTIPVRKMLFTIVIGGNEGLPISLAGLATKFNGDARENASSIFSPETRVQQIGFYRDTDNGRGVFTGVAEAYNLIEVNYGMPQLVGDNSYNAEVITFVDAVLAQAGLADVKCTWVVVPLDDLGGGFGTLHIKGMGGISGSS